jgi:hypothetical protein
MAGLSPEQRRTLVLLEGRRPVGEIAEQGITGEVLSGLGRLARQQARGDGRSRRRRR